MDDTLNTCSLEQAETETGGETDDTDTDKKISL